MMSHPLVHEDSCELWSSHCCFTGRIVNQFSKFIDKYYNCIIASFETRELSNKIHSDLFHWTRGNR